MKDDDKNGIPRRHFLKSTAAGAAAAVLGMGSIRSLLAQAKQTGKPVLTAAALNSLFSGDRSRAAEAIKEAKRDVKAFVRNRFTLTGSQEEQLNSISRENVDTIGALLDVAARLGTTLQVSFAGLEASNLAARPDTTRLSFGGSESGAGRGAKCQTVNVNVSLSLYHK
jgi:hypothetical protein